MLGGQRQGLAVEALALGDTRQADHDHGDVGVAGHVDGRCEEGRIVR